MKFSSSALVALFCIGSGVDGARLRGVRSQRRAQADPALEVVVPGKVDVTTPLSLCQGDCDQDSDCEGMASQDQFLGY